jgi:ribosomal protein L7/L12
MQDLQPLIKNLMGFAQKQLGFERPPKLFLKQDAENAKNMLGKTAFYDPQAESITLFVSSRHPKDILRSLAHELVHHTQNLRGDLSPEKCGEMGMGYAQNNAHLREMEREAYEKGNLCFRDWEDGYKIQLQQQQEQKVKSLKESKTMTVKISKDELKDLILKVLKEEKAVTTEQADPLTTALKDPIAYLGYFGFHQDGRKINAYDDAKMAKKGEAYPRFSKEGEPAQSYARSIQFGADDLRKARIRRGMMQRGSDIKAVGAFTKGLEAGEKAAATRKELERAAADQWGQYSTMDVLKAKGDLQKRALPGAGLRDLVQLQRRVGAEETVSLVAILLVHLRDILHAENSKKQPVWRVLSPHQNLERLVKEEWFNDLPQEARTLQLVPLVH